MVFTFYPVSTVYTVSCSSFLSSTGLETVKTVETVETVETSPLSPDKKQTVFVVGTKTASVVPPR